MTKKKQPAEVWAAIAIFVMLGVAWTLLALVNLAAWFVPMSVSLLLASAMLGVLVLGIEAQERKR